MINIYEEDGKLIVELKDMIIKATSDYEPTISYSAYPADWNVEIRIKNIEHNIKLETK